MTRMTEAIRAAAQDEIREIEAGTAQRTYLFSHDFPGFAGHFPGYPILPAIVQLQIALCLAEDYQGAPLTLAGVENAKFLQQLRPAEKIRVQCRLRRRDGRPVGDGRLWRGEELAASFLLLLAEAER
jgi:3-hydroxyacyl-[acyl-carrier-protein] dehydratase